jgi:superfamily II DNA or RNA helicase
MHEWRDQLRATYRSGSTSLSDAFFKPCLRECVRYRRAAGYFSSSALLAWAEALQGSAGAHELTVDLLISPELSAMDRLALERSASPADSEALLQRGADALISAILSAPAEPQPRADYLVWLIASGRLQLQFAYPREPAQGMFHQKVGLFELADGARVAFEGSANETGAGHRHNYEGLQVFRSWVAGDEERLQLVQDDFERLWSRRDDHLVVVPLSAQALALVRERARDSERPSPGGRNEDDRWAHQRAAVAAFLAQPHGVLQMATGTGKTRTALQIAARLFEQRAIDSVVVSTSGNDLLDQWCAELLAWRAAGGRAFSLQKHFGSRHDGMSFAMKPAGAVLVVSREQVAKFIGSLTSSQAARTLVVHDEVHGLGAPQARQELAGVHASFGYVLGLSATPDREYDAEGTAFIEGEVGPVVFEFGLEDAIRKGILVEFDYVTLPYELTVSDRARLRTVYSRQAARKAEGRPMSQEEVWTELSKVYKTAEDKPAVFAAYLADQPECLRNCIVFVEERAYGDRLLPMLHAAGVRYRNYYADDESEHLRAFGRGEIDCVVTCHKVSQGIDIRQLRTVVLFSSARARLETVQRIGRCLRRDPDDPEKRALVVDFVLTERGDEVVDSADSDRANWLRGLSAVRRGELPDANR